MKYKNKKLLYFTEFVVDIYETSQPYYPQLWQFSIVIFRLKVG